MRFHLLYCPLVLCVLLAPARGSIEGLALRLPGGVNILCVFNVEKMLSTPMAVKEDWKNKHEQAFEAGVSVVPPNANSVVIGGKMDLEFMQSSWEIAMFDLDYAPSAAEIAAKRGGDVDRIVERDAVRLPDDSYLVLFNENRAGIMRPANRQSVSQWLRSTDRTSGTPNLPDYLLESLSFATKSGTPIIMAIDLSDTLSPSRVQKRLGQLKCLAGTKLDLQAASIALSSIRGVTLGITIKDRVFGKVKVDFEKEIGIDAETGKQILLEVLANNDAMINEFDSWEAKTTANQLTLEGYLYPSGLRKILSVLDIPATLKKPEPAATGSDSLADNKLMMLASKQYFKSVDGYLKDIRRQKGEIQGWSQAGIWISRYARKIDALPLVNVDPEMLDYGKYVSDALRDASDALRGIAGRARVRQVNAPATYNTYGRWGMYGGYQYTVEDTQAEQQDRSRISAEERIAGTTSARGIFDEIERATGTIRRTMAEKYKENF